MKRHATDDAICSCKVCHIYSADADNCAPLLQGLKFLCIIFTKSLLHTQMKFMKKKLSNRFNQNKKGSRNFVRMTSRIFSLHHLKPTERFLVKSCISTYLHYFCPLTITHVCQAIPLFWKHHFFCCATLESMFYFHHLKNHCHQRSILCPQLPQSFQQQKLL